MIGPGFSAVRRLGLPENPDAEQRGEKDGDDTRTRAARCATTAKIEKVYSPAALRANPIGTKPAIVTSVPVSIGNAVEL